MISQNRKNSIREASTTCKAKLNSGPVNRIPTVMVHRMRNPRIKRVRWLGFFMGNSLGWVVVGRCAASRRGQGFWPGY